YTGCQSASGRSQRKVGSMPLWIIVVFQLAGAAKFFWTFCLDFGAAGPDRARGPGWTVGLELDRFCCRSLRTGNP
ncbi:hypothetical protein GOODEAATRI_033235, partial [Goodea atripinnis]